VEYVEKIMTKKQYRQKMLALRSGLYQSEVSLKSRKVMEGFLGLEGLEERKDYLAYLPVRNEVDTRPLLSRLIDMDKNVYVPKCDKACEGKMDFFRLTLFSDLKPGYHGIDEPCPDSAALFVNNGRAVCILPGLAFDRSGYRLGYGRGFFDRYLKSLPGPGPVLVGFAYDFQIVDSLPRDDWDVPVDMVITDQEVIPANPEKVA
jgi:5-formyltetrahydrofolate cyclo-ligase